MITIPSWISDGTADEVQVQAAIDSLPVASGVGQVGGGKISIPNKTLTLSAPININLIDGGPVIEGEGRGTRLAPVNGGFAFVIGSAGKFSYGTILRDFSLGNASGKGINIPNGDTIVLENIYANYIDTFIQALGDAGETNWLTIRNCEAFYISTVGLDINAQNVLIEKVYLHSTAALGATHLRLRSDVTPHAVVINNCLFEIGAIGARIDGGTGVVIEHSVFSDLANYAISLSAHQSRISYNQFHNISGTPIVIPAGVTGVVVEYNTETGTDPGVPSIDIEGYNNDGFKARGNSLGATLGVIEEDEVDKLKDAFGIRVDDADFCYPFSNSDGVNDRVWELAKIRNLYLYNAPTWGTFDGTKWGKLTMTSAGSQYGRFPAPGYSNLINVAGDKTLIWAGKLNFIPDGHIERHLLGLGLVGGTTANNFGFYYDNNLLVFSAQGATGNAAAMIIRDGNGAGAWSLGEPVVLIGTIKGTTMKAYSNGTYSGTVTLASALVTSAQTLWLNTRSDLTRFGDVDEGAAVCLPRVLSGKEVTEISERLLGLIGG